MCCPTHWLKCLHEHVISSAWSSTLCGCPFFDPLFLALFLSVCLSFTLLFSSHFDLDTDLNLFLHVVVAKASIPCASAKWVWPLGRKHPSHTWLVRPANESDCTITDYSSRFWPGGFFRSEASFPLYFILSSWTCNHLHVYASICKICTSSRSDLMTLAMPLERHVLVSSSHSLCFIFGLLLTLTLRNTHHEHHVMASKKKKMFPRVLPWKGHIVLWHVVHTRVDLKSILLIGSRTFVFVTEFPHVRLGLPMDTILDLLLANRFRRPTWRNGYTWVMILPESSAWRMFLRWYRVLVTLIVRPEATWSSTFSTKTNGQPCALTWELLGPQGTASFWERTEAPFASTKTWVQFYSPEAAQSFSWTPGAAVSKWRDPVGLRGYCLLGHRPIPSVGKDRPLMLPGYDISSMFKKPLQNSARHQKGDTIHLLGIPLRQKFASSFDCKSDAASTTGTLDLDVEWKCFWETNRRQMACHYLARSVWLRRPRASHESLPRDPLRRMYSPSSTRTPSTPILTSSPFTFMTPGAICLIKWWKESRDGLCKACFHVPHFVDHHSAARRHLRCSLFIQAKSTPKKRCIAKKLILTIRAIMTGQHWHGCRWFQWKSMAMQQQRQHKYYWRSFCRLCVANAAGPYTIVGTRIDSKQLGWRLRVPQSARFWSVLEGTHAWCFLHPKQNYRPASNRSKLPSWDVKTTPQKHRFRSVRMYKIYKEFTCRWKVNMWEHWQQMKWGHEKAERQAQQNGRKPEACEHSRER